MIYGLVILEQYSVLDEMTPYLKIQPWIISTIFVGFNVLRIIGSLFDYMNLEFNDVIERCYLDLNLAVIGLHPFSSIAFSVVLIALDLLLVPGFHYKRKNILLIWLSAYVVVLTLIIAKLFVTCGWFFFLLIIGKFSDSLSFLASFALQGFITLVNINSWEFVKYNCRLIEKIRASLPVENESVIIIP